MNIIERIRTDIMGVLDKHAATVETVLADASKAAESPAAQMVGGLAHIPPGAMQAFGEAMAKVDAEFAKLAPADPTPTPTASPNLATAGGDQMSEPASFQPPVLDLPDRPRDAG